MAGFSGSSNISKGAHQACFRISTCTPCVVRVSARLVPADEGINVKLKQTTDVSADRSIDEPWRVKEPKTGVFGLRHAQVRAWQPKSVNRT